jgi:hypothetical protein
LVTSAYSVAGALLERLNIYNVFSLSVDGEGIVKQEYVTPAVDLTEISRRARVCAKIREFVNSYGRGPVLQPRATDVRHNNMREVFDAQLQPTAPRCTVIGEYGVPVSRVPHATGNAHDAV